MTHYSGMPSDEATLYDVAYYVFPRELAIAPAKYRIRVRKFNPEILTIVYRASRVVEIGVGKGLKIFALPCEPQTHNSPAITPTDVWLHHGFPYNFASIYIGDSLEKVYKKFGKFTITNASHDFFSYYPVPIMIDSLDVNSTRTVNRIAIGGERHIPNFSFFLSANAELDPVTCAVKSLNFHE